MPTTITLALRKATDNKLVFGQIVDENDPFAVALIPSLYIDKRDVRAMGFSEETPRFELTLKAVK